MPYIKATVSKEISPAAQEALKAKLGQAIALIPGKTEAWLMLSFEDNARMYFRGENDADYAFVQVALFGDTSDAAYDRLTVAITEIVNETLSIDPANIYITYLPYDHWGWNGSNF
ncbi:MAG: hypothetical protein IJK64_08645 [Clostridia bacterium]|nr:hypothetical protein [Clostridia bacterium]